MSKPTVAKTGGTSNCDAQAVQASLQWAEQSDIFIPSAPGKLHGVTGPHGDKVTNMLLAARDSYVTTGSVPSPLTGVITQRFADIVGGLGKSKLPASWVDSIAPRIEESVRHSRDTASMLGERLQAEIYEAHGYTILDPGRAQHNLGTNPDRWRDWLQVAYRPGRKYVLPGNTTRVHGRLVTFSRGGSDISGGFAAYGVMAELNLNLTDSGAKSADPRLIDAGSVKDLHHLLYVEGRELGRNGTGLVHPAAMIPLMLGNITTEIRSTFDRDAPYTTLDNDYERAGHRVGQIIALSLMEDVVVHRINEPGMAEGVGRLAAFENALADEGVAVIDSQGDGVDGQKYFVDSSQAVKAAKALGSVVDGGSVESSERMSFITLVGYKLEKRMLDNIFRITNDAGIDGKSWQAMGYPLSTGRHSLRIGVHPQHAADALKKIHQISVEAEAAAV